MLIRYGEPNKYDQAPRGTQCCVFLSESKKEYYVQLNDDEENPRWERVEFISNNIELL